MKISLENFKHHHDLEIELPETGLVRLSGRSGAGKSSVLQAIQYALFGKTKNITTWNTDRTRVSLQGFGLDIERTKNPNHLLCNSLPSKTAQDEIENVLGMNSIEFNISSYVSQGQRSSLINLPPAEQMKLIHALAFRDKDPEEAKDQIKTFMKSKEETINQAVRELERLDERYSNFKDSIEYLQSTLPEITENEEEVTENLRDLHEKHTKLKAEFSENRVEKTEIETRLKGIDPDKLQRARTVILDSQQRLPEINFQLEELTNASQAKELQALIETIENSKNELGKITAEHKRLKYQTSKAVDADKLEEILADSIGKIQAVVAFGGVAREDESLADDLLTMKMSSEAALSAIDSLKLASSKEEMNAVRRQMKDIQSRIKEISEEVERYENVKNEETERKTRIRLLNETKTKIEERTQKAEEFLDSLRLDEDVGVIQNKLQEIKDRENKLLEELNEVGTEFSLCEQKYEQIHNAKKGRKKLESLKQEVKKIDADIEQQENIKADAEKHHKAAQRLLVVWTKASLDVIENTIREINLRAGFWLELLLEGKVAAELQTTKTVKTTNQTIDSINLDIMFKGQTLSKISEELSGGQYSRVVLAFQLALSDIYNSPVLMLDESARGCDLETIEVMLDALKTISARKLVILIEHNVPSYHFDKEVEFADV